MAMGIYYHKFIFIQVTGMNLIVSLSGFNFLFFSLSCVGILFQVTGNKL